MLASFVSNEKLETSVNLFKLIAFCEDIFRRSSISTCSSIFHNAWIEEITKKDNTIEFLIYRYLRNSLFSLLSISFNNMKYVYVMDNLCFCKRVLWVHLKFMCNFALNWCNSLVVFRVSTLLLNPSIRFRRSFRTFFSIAVCCNLRCT